VFSAVDYKEHSSALRKKKRCTVNVLKGALACLLSLYAQQNRCDSDNLFSIFKFLSSFTFPSLSWKYRLQGVADTLDYGVTERVWNELLSGG